MSGDEIQVEQIKKRPFGRKKHKKRTDLSPSYIEQ
jgi:hypothetical protein